MALVVLAIAIGLTLATVSLATIHIKSSTAFHAMLKDTFLRPSTTGITVTKTLLDAPDGWDSIHFSTELSQTASPGVVSYSWRVSLRQPCMPMRPAAEAFSTRPTIILVIDDSTSMRGSCGRDYDPDSLYLKSPLGTITKISSCSEVVDSLASSPGAFFRGAYGNVHERAPSSHGLSGAMSVWTLGVSRALALLDGTAGCSVGLLSTSGAVCIHPSTDIRAIESAIDAMSPSSGAAPLAESLYRATQMAHGPCSTARHIVLVTAGIPVRDGNVPAWLTDYDHDSDPNDRFIEGEGCRCLDDVASYARLTGITVHVIGPDIPFLRVVASKGGGRFMPEHSDIGNGTRTVSVAPVAFQGSHYILDNRGGDMHPAWLSTDNALGLRLSVADPLESISCPDITLAGTALSFALKGPLVYCTTTRERVVRIDLARLTLDRVMLGVSGDVVVRAGHIVAGPSRSGEVYVMSEDLGVSWRTNASFADASDEFVYCTLGSTIQARRMETGDIVGFAEAGGRITSLRFDPASQKVLAGTEDGIAVMFDRLLGRSDMLSTGTRDPILDIRPFSLRNSPHTAVITKSRIYLFRGAEQLWSHGMEGMPVAVTVMDGRIYALVWQAEEGPCSGSDVGVSSLSVFDAATGAVLDTRTLFSGKGFGPFVDTDACLVRFVSFTGETSDIDISSLCGVKPAPLGRKLISPAN